MFGLIVPSTADTTVQIRLTLSRGGPLVAWEGLPDVSDDTVTSGMLANRTVVAYLWAALTRGKLQDDELGFVHVPGRVVALRNGAIVFDQKVTMPMMLPPRSSPTAAPTSNFQVQRDLLTMVETALSAMQRNASEVIAQVGLASINALKELNAAQCKSMERTQEAMERLGNMIVEASRPAGRRARGQQEQDVARGAQTAMQSSGTGSLPRPVAKVR